MKQLLLKNGAVEVTEVPSPMVEPGTILVQVEYSCISTGTEISGLRSSGEALWRRALKHPNEVKQAFDMAAEQGVRRIHRMIKSKLTSGTAIGYSLAGRVIDVGEGVRDVSVDDLVACSGAQCAHHAEVVRVPRNLCTKISANLDSKFASTVTLGTVALQGVRRLKPTLGETIVVLGLGVLGQIGFQLLKANGCRVIGVDLNDSRVRLAKKLGIDYAFHPDEVNSIDHVHRLTDGYGADGVMVSAAGSSDEIMSQAFRMCRKRGRVVLVGDVGLNLRRQDIFKNELDFYISTSYGPGRYDPTYEEGGIDYPFGDVRWTENRNMQEYVRLLVEGTVNLDGLVSKAVPVEDADDAYQRLKSETGDMIVLLEYPKRSIDTITASTIFSKQKDLSGEVGLGLIGAGSFAKGMHLPNIERMSDIFSLRAIMSRTGHNAKAVADQFNAGYSTTDFERVMQDDEVDAVVITTRHNLHGSQVLSALQAGKHVFVEKPLALNEAELDAIESLYLQITDLPMLMTGFNRRFSPHVQRLKEIIEGRSNPMIINYKMNAGFVSQDNWIHGPEGGGRNLGEACHIYDLFTFLTGSQVVDVKASAITPNTGSYGANDNFVATCTFSDGSVATLIYTALGSKEFPKERMEVFVDGKVIEMDDYKTLKITGVKQKGLNTKRMLKGQEEGIKVFGDAIVGAGEWPIPLWEQVQATRIAIRVEKQISVIV